MFFIGFADSIRANRLYRNRPENGAVTDVARFPASQLGCIAAQC